MCFFIFLCAAYSRSLWSVCNIRAHMKPLIDCSMQCIINFLQMQSELYALKYIRVLCAQFSSFFDYWLRSDSSSSFHFSLSLVGFFFTRTITHWHTCQKMLVSVDNSRVSKLANINGFDYTDSLLHRTDRNGWFSFFLASSPIFKYQFGLWWIAHLVHYTFKYVHAHSSFAHRQNVRFRFVSHRLAWTLADYAQTWCFSSRRYFSCMANV